MNFQTNNGNANRFDMCHENHGDRLNSRYWS